MKDLVLDEHFLRSSVNLAHKIRERILEQLQTFTTNPRDPDLDMERLEGSKQLHSIRLDANHRIILRMEKSVTTLLFIETEDSPYPFAHKTRQATPVHRPGMYPNEMVIAPMDSLERLLVEEKYLPLTKYFLGIDTKNREVQFRFLQIEEILNAHLPPEARKFPNWWANQKSGKRPHAFAWMSAGWLVSRVDVRAAVVTFTRQSTP